MSARRPLWEALAVYAGVSLGVALLPWLVGGVFSGYLGTLAGALYLAVPLVVCRFASLEPNVYAPLDFPTARAVLGVLLLALVLFPPFYVAGQWLGLVAPKAGLALPSVARDSAGLVSWVLSTLLVVALPEELFFRGYLQRRLDDAFLGRVKIAGVEVGHGLFIGAALFALAHMLTVRSAFRLFTFFPGLVFGWLRLRTNGIGAGALFHALCNLYIDALSAGAPRQD